MQKITNVDLKLTGSTKIFTPNFTSVFYFTNDIIVYCTAASNITQSASISVGTNANSYDNILPLTNITNLTVSGSYFRIPINGLSFGVPKDTDVFVNIQVAAIGVSQIATVMIDGFYG